MFEYPYPEILHQKLPTTTPISPRISNPFISCRVYSMNPFGIGKIVWLCRIRAGSLWTFFDDRPFHVPVKNMKAMNVKLIIRIHILLEYVYI
jgi:hypothetical protein